MGITIQGDVYADSSAALGITQRTGNGKVRHLRVQALWVQEVRSTGRLGYKKILGILNPADILTKHVPGKLLDQHIKTLGMEFRGGRAHSAPSLCSLKVETSDSFEDHEEEKPNVPKSCLEFGGGCFELVTFSPIQMCRPIPAVGRQVPTSRARKTRAEERLHMTESVEVRGLNTPLLSFSMYRLLRRTPPPTNART